MWMVFYKSFLRNSYFRFISLFNLDNLTDNDLVNIIMYGNEAFACMETNNIWKINTDTLDAIEKVIGDHLKLPALF